MYIFMYIYILYIYIYILYIYIYIIYIYIGLAQDGSTSNEDEF